MTEKTEYSGDTGRREKIVKVEDYLTGESRDKWIKEFG